MLTYNTISFLICILSSILDVTLIDTNTNNCDKNRCRNNEEQHPPQQKQQQRKHCFHDQDSCWCQNNDGQLVKSRKVSDCYQVLSTSSNAKRTCSHRDRARFNDNFIAMLRNEWRKKFNVDDLESSSIFDSSRDVLEWKFINLDQNKDDFLKKDEFRRWKRMVKRVIRPRECANNFLRNADKNNDKLISIEEWLNFFTSNASIGITKPLPNNRNFTLKTTTPTSTTTFRLSPPNGILKVMDKVDNTEKSIDETEVGSNCEIERKTVISENISDAFLPECTKDGHYDKVQCYHTAKYCWCVDKNTGKNIPNTSVYDKKPNCDKEFSPEAKGQYRNCPNPDFFKQLYKRLPNVAPENAEKFHMQTLAIEVFRKIDKSTNEFIERNEWRTFRSTILGKNTQNGGGDNKSFKMLRRCSRKLMQRCDRNSDGIINVIEWLRCFNLNKYLLITVPFTPSPELNNTKLGDNITTTNFNRRSGPNPLDSVLKDDDDYINE